jgi:hypothetical protein
MCKAVFFDNYRIEWQRAGTMEAIVSNNQLIAHYNFILEGMHAVREVYLPHQSKNLVQTNIENMSF